MALPRPGEAPAPEFDNLKYRIAKVRETIQEADDATTRAQEAWIRHVMEQRNFAQSFAEGYPRTRDEMNSLAKTFAKESQSVYDRFLRKQSPEHETSRKLRLGIKAYLSEIARVEALYPQVTRAFTKLSPVLKKLQSLENTTNESGNAADIRQKEKLIITKNRLEDTISMVLAAQRQIMELSEAMHKTAMVAYWHANAAHFNMAADIMKSTATFARTNLAELCATDISTISKEDATSDNSNS